MNTSPRIPALEEIDADWDTYSVILCKPDCVERRLVTAVLARLSQAAEIITHERVTVSGWQIYTHYRDLIVNRDTFDLDVPGALWEAYVGLDVVIALAHGGAGTPARLRALLGHFDPSVADSATIRGELGRDSLAVARKAGRLVENLVHTSDDAESAAWDFAIWFGTARHHLLPTATSLTSSHTIAMP